MSTEEIIEGLKEIAKEINQVVKFGEKDIGWADEYNETLKDAIKLIETLGASLPEGTRE